MVNLDSKSIKIGIALFGKGGTNHLHRPEVVEAFHRQNAEVIFVVSHHYESLLDRIPGCAYVTARIAAERGMRERLRKLFRYMRRLYPAADPGVRHFNLPMGRACGLKNRLLHEMLSLFARWRTAMQLAVAVESMLYRSETMEGLDPAMFDQFLVLGIGIYGSSLEGTLTWWARRNRIPVVHIVGNYDNLSSKGFRGVPVDRILVWGESMRRDAVELQAIKPERVREIGSIRYNGIAKVVRSDCESVLREWGLDPKRRTILFAGSLSEFHYFEMLAILKELRKESDDMQVIMRVYPNKSLMNSVYMEPLLEYAAGISGVFTSLADPCYDKGLRERDVLQIEERELWNALRCADVVVNIFSTIALEACIFDKPAVHMWYFGWPGRLAASPPVWKAYPKLIHHRRMAAYGAIPVATNRDELIKEIRDALANPGRFRAERARAVANECGPLDGLACDRLVKSCMEWIVRDSATIPPGVHDYERAEVQR